MPTRPEKIPTMILEENLTASKNPARQLNFLLIKRNFNEISTLRFQYKKSLEIIYNGYIYQ